MLQAIETTYQATDSLALAAMGAAVVQVLKNSSNPALRWISENKPWVVRSVAALGASIAAAGMTWKYEGDTLTVTGLTVWTGLSFVWTTIKQFAFQEVAFRAAGPVVKPTDKP